MFQPQFNLTIALVIACITTLYGMQTVAAPANPSINQVAKAVDTVDKSVECTAFTTITDKAAGARNTMDLSVALRYINDLKQDLQALRVKDVRLKSLQERYLQFTVDMGGKLEKTKREQAQGNYGALLTAMPTLTATGNKGSDLERELLQYCRRS
jgi:hypothetical protein